MRLKCSNLSVWFRSNNHSIQALDRISLEARDGEFLAVIGPSGCGKTTLLRSLAGLIKPSEGVIEQIPEPQSCGGRSLLVFQEDGLFPWMTVLQNAAFGLEMQGRGKPERERLARELLSRYGLSNREKAYPSQLSVGMKQRVAVIRSFLSEPSMLLMDEPFAALDAQTKITLQQELLSLWDLSHCNVVFVTHDVDEAIMLGDRILVMSPQPGRIIAQHQVQFDRPRSTVTALDREFLRLKRELYEQLGVSFNQPAHVSYGE